MHQNEVASYFRNFGRKWSYRFRAVRRNLYTEQSCRLSYVSTRTKKKTNLFGARLSVAHFLIFKKLRCQQSKPTKSTTTRFKGGTWQKRAKALIRIPSNEWREKRRISPSRWTTKSLGFSAFLMFKCVLFVRTLPTQQSGFTELSRHTRLHTTTFSTSKIWMMDATFKCLP